MPSLIGEAGFMALYCLLLVVLRVGYRVVAFQAGEQADLDTEKEAGPVTRDLKPNDKDFYAGLPEIMLNNSQLQVPNLQSPKPRGHSPEHSHGRAIQSDRLNRTVCSRKDISIFQHTSGNRGGISEFHVEILNTCVSSCPPSNLHLNCGWFATVELVNPNKFQRLGYNDCLVNGGEALPYGTLIAFTYANSFMYPLSFKSATFCY